MRDNSIFIWDILKTNKSLFHLKEHNGNINTITFSSNSQKLLTASDDGTAILWEPHTGKLIRKFKHKSKVIKAKFSPKEDKIVTISSENEITTWDIEDKKNYVTTGIQKERIIDFCFYNNSSKLITIDNNRNARILDYNTGKYTNKHIELKNKQPVKIDYIAENEVLITNRELIANGKRITNEDGYYDIYNTITGEKLKNPFYISTKKLPGDRINKFSLTTNFVDAIFSPDGKYIATTDEKAKIIVWSISTGDNITWFPGSDAKFSSDGKNIIATSETTIRILNVDTTHWDPFPYAHAHKEQINSVYFSPDGSKILSASDDKTIKLWDKKNRKLIFSKDFNTEVKSAKFSPDGNRIAVITDKITICKENNGDTIFEINEQDVSNVQFSLDSKKILFSNKNETICYDIATKQKEYAVPGELIAVIADNKKIATYQNQEINFWNINTGELFYKKLEENKIYDFSLDGNRFITNYLKTANIQSTSNSNKILYSIETNSFFKACFSPDGNKILTVSEKEVQVWNTPQLLTYETENCFQIVKQKPKVEDVKFTHEVYPNNAITFSFNNFIVNEKEYPIIIREIQIDSLKIVENKQVKNKDADCFIVETNTSPFTIPPHSKAGCDFKFKSGTIGTKEAKLIVITSNDTIRTATISGTSIVEPIDFVNSEINFGKVIPTTQKDTIVNIFRNTSSSTIKIKQIENTGPDTSQFKLNKNYIGETIEQGKDLNFNISFNPYQRGLTNTKLKIYFENQKQNTIELMLLGEGEAPREITLNGKCISKGTNTPIKDSIFCYDYITGNLITVTKTDKAGNYSLKIPVDRKYIIIAESPDYFHGSSIIDLTELVLNKQKNDTIIQTEIKDNTTSIISSISFESGISELPYDIMKELDHIARLMKNNQDIKIEIHGYSDNDGSSSENQKISENRAKKVENYLVAKNISKNRITAEGKGDTQPIATNETEEGRNKNRRIEIEILP